MDHYCEHWVEDHVVSSRSMKKMKKYIQLYSFLVMPRMTDVSDTADQGIIHTKPSFISF